MSSISRRAPRMPSASSVANGSTRPTSWKSRSIPSVRRCSSSPPPTFRPRSCSIRWKAISATGQASPKELLACLDDEQVNIYRDICNQLVLPSVSKEKPDVIGISIGTQMQLIAGLTFCKMIQETFPNVHVVIGGNVVTRLQEEWPKHEQFFKEVFDMAILYEGEHALLWLIEALNGQREMTSVPNLMYRNAAGVQQNKEIYTER